LPPLHLVQILKIFTEKVTDRYYPLVRQPLEETDKPVRHSFSRRRMERDCSYNPEVSKTLFYSLKTKLFTGIERARSITFLFYIIK
jgi:hypothetical protein